MHSIYVTGLHRSGTTILAFVIGSHPDCVAVGEVWNCIQPDIKPEVAQKRHMNCSCRQKPCPFWLEVMHAISKKSSIGERYRRFTEVFADNFPGKILVDSSKGTAPYEALSQLGECRAIGIIRDVRGWCLSTNGKITPRGMLRWWQGNRRQKKDFSGVPYVGYEDLVFNTKQVTYDLFRMLGLSEHLPPENLFRPDNHVMVANRMRTTLDLRMNYDHRWLSQASLWPVIFFPIMSYNRICYGSSFQRNNLP